MSKIIRNGIEYGGTATTANQVQYSPTETVADKIDELDGEITPFASIKNQFWSDLSVGANTIDTRDLTVTVPAKYGIVCGFAISNTSTSAILQCYFSSKTNLHIRILNTGNYQTLYGFMIYYI